MKIIKTNELPAQVREHIRAFERYRLLPIRDNRAHREARRLAAIGQRVESERWFDVAYGLREQ